MDVHVGTVDIQSLQLPGSAAYVNVVLVVAMLVYIISTIYRTIRHSRTHKDQVLLNDRMTCTTYTDGGWE